VAAARADIAFVDAVTWRDICRYEPDLVAPLRALGHTAPTPGLPYIAAATADTGQIAGAVETAIAGLDAVDRDALGIVGLVRFAPADYQALAIPAPP
jgi:ABC-type phosphate/phosphonate transport system substrate-binding protein